jgi:phosphohistidine phosphatase
MLLYVLRHADAVDRASSDAVRELTPKGLDQARRVGRFCKTYGLIPNLILTSPYVRAKQTAEVVAEQLGGMEVVPAEFLSSGMDAETALAELKAYVNFERVMLVGHEPDLGLLSAQLTGAIPGSFHVRKASLTCFKLDAPKPSGGQLSFSIPAKFM